MLPINNVKGTETNKFFCLCVFKTTPGNSKNLNYRLQVTLMRLRVKFLTQHLYYQSRF